MGPDHVSDKASKGGKLDPIGGPHKGGGRRRKGPKSAKAAPPPCNPSRGEESKQKVGAARAPPKEGNKAGVASGSQGHRVRGVGSGKGLAPPKGLRGHKEGRGRMGDKEEGRGSRKEGGGGGGKARSKEDKKQREVGAAGGSKKSGVEVGRGASKKEAGGAQG